MGVEIDHDQPPGGRERARRLVQRPGRIVEEVQHLMDDDEVVAVALDRRRVDVALAELDVAQARLVDAAARASASIAALWSTPTARTARGASSSSMRPVPVPRSSRLRNGFSPIMASERRLDPLLGGVQGADAVPVGRLLGEIGRGLLAARLARDFEPGAVGGERRVGGIEPADEVAGERRRRRSARRKNAHAPSRWRDGEARPRPEASDGARRAAATGRGWRRAR